MIWFNDGIYFIAEKSIWHESDPAQGLGVFYQSGYTQSDRNQLSLYQGAGLNYTGLLPGRDEDTTGIAFAYARNGSDFIAANPGTERAETVLEFTYSAKLLPYLALQPDLQYIIHPSMDPELDDALALTLRVTANM